MTRVAWYTAVILGTLTILLLVWQFREAVILFLFSLAFAAAIRPIVDFLSSRGFHRLAAVLVAHVIIVIGIVGLFWLISYPVIAEVQSGINSILVNYEWLKHQWQTSTTPLLTQLADKIPATTVLYESIATGDSGLLVRSMLGIAEGAFDMLGGLAIIITLSMYWNADQVRTERMWLSLLPYEHRARWRDIWRSIEEGVGAYIRSAVVQIVIAGVLLWVGYSALGLSYVVLLTILGALTRLIPRLGIIIGTLWALLIGIEAGVGVAIAAAIFTAGVLLFLELALEPRLFSRNQYSSLLLMLLLIAMADSFGLAGIILASPLSVAVQILIWHLLPLFKPGTVSDPVSTVSSIKSRIDNIQNVAASQEKPITPEIKNLTERLEKLLISTHAFLEGEQE